VKRGAVNHPGVFQEIGKLAFELPFLRAGHLEGPEVYEPVYVDLGFIFHELNILHWTYVMQINFYGILPHPRPLSH